MVWWVSMALNYSEHLLISACTVTGNVFIFAFSSPFGGAIGIVSCPV